MTELNTDGLPYAEHITIGMCKEPRCGKLHLILFDANDKPMAIASIDDPLEHIELIRHWAYIAATRRPV